MSDEVSDKPPGEKPGRVIPPARVDVPKLPREGSSNAATYVMVGAIMLCLVLVGAYLAMQGREPEPTAWDRAQERKAEAELRESVARALSREVVYEVEGSGGASSAGVTVTTPTGTEQATPSLPLRNQAGELGVTHEFGPGEFVYVSAQNEGEYGSVTCRITVDGVVVSENTSSGAYGIATCEGRS